MTNETTASQPKSIGDDAQFQRLLTAWDITKAGSNDCVDTFNALVTYIDSRAPAAQASATIQAAHPDDIAVDMFACAMKAKMAESRAKGRSGWDDPHQCNADFLQRALLAHAGKGDPVDVGNFAMMLWNRGESTATIQEPVMVAEPVGDKFSRVGFSVATGSARIIVATAITQEWADRIVSALAAPMVADRWHDAVKDACTVACIDWTDDPRKTIDALINWHVEIALDPAVSDRAPMVADPAGVALQNAAGLLRPLVQDGFEVRIKHARPVLAAIDKALAATVKAVPSEALDRNQLLDEIADMVGACDKRASLKGIAAAIRCMKSAAPLADKTGGGE